MRYRIFITILIMGIVMQNLLSQQASSIVYEDENGCLRYVADQQNNYIPDFSYAGYQNGESLLPVVSVVKTIGPVSGDNTAHIQAALDEVGGLPPDEQGIRGALLLEPGLYEVHGVLTIHQSGCILRGSGDGEDPATNTILLGIGNTPDERDIIKVGNGSGVNWTGAVSGSRSMVTGEFIPSGSRSLQVSAPELYNVGDNVIVYQPSTSSWLASINFGDTDIDDPWSPGQIDLFFNRYITAIDLPESKIVLDAPIYDHLERSLAQAEVYILNEPDIKRNIGIENLRVDIQTAGPFDESHANNAIRLIGVEDCWVTNVTALHFSYAAVDMQVASRVTVRNCQGLEPHSLIEGARRYNFAVGQKSNNILFENCHATEGRHSFVSNGTSSVSGIVFYNCTSQRDYNSSEGHRRWSQGLLFDNIEFSDPETTNLLGLYNRGSYGTGHGWSAVHSVAWNIKMPANNRTILQKPPHRQNYAIGCQGVVTNAHQFSNPPGFQDLTNQVPLIQSLYAIQLEKRLQQGIPPDAPARLSATWTGEAVELNWLDVASQEVGYKVEMSTDGGNTFTEIAELPAEATTFIHSDISGLMGELVYRVYAVGNACPSPFSNPSTVDISTGVRLISIPGLEVFPNPVTDTLFVRAQSSLLKIEVYDVSGALVKASQTDTEIITQDWTPGAYFLKIIDESGRTDIVKMIKT